MKISKINFNLLNSNLKLQEFFLPQLFAKVNFQGQNQDTFTKSNDFSNKKAIQLLRTELKKIMTPKEVYIYTQKIKKMCKRLGIEPKNLPINNEHPGNLKDYQWQQISFLVKEDAIQQNKK